MSDIKRIVLDVLKPHKPSLAINYPSVEEALRELGAVIHSVDLVSSGKRLVEDVRTGQDHG